jgi:hypothetical protein
MGIGKPRSWLVVLILAVPSLIARAADDPAPANDVRAEAHLHYQRAIELADDGAYAEAVVEFRRAYELLPHPTVLYNLGQAYAALGKPVEAVDAFKRYLSDGGSEVTPERQSQVAAEIQRQETRIALLLIETNVSGADIRVDGLDVGKSPLPAPIRIAVGDHRVAASLEGYRSGEQSVTVTGEEQRAVSLVLEKIPAPVVLALPPRPEPSPSNSSRATVQERRLGYSLGAAGLAAATSALGLYIWNKQRYDQWNTTDADLAANPNTPNFADRRSANDALANSIRHVNTATIALAIGGGALLASGAVLITLSYRNTAGALHAFRIGPGGAVWEVHW